MAQGSVLVANEAAVGQLFATELAAEAGGMPISGHRLDNSTDHELAAFVAAGRKEDVEVPLAVLAALELVENAVWEGTEALGAPES